MVALDAPPATHVLRGHGVSPARPHNPRELPRVRGYDVLEVIGTGGMGVVYRARHRDLRRTVALKTIRPTALSDPDFLERFYAEAEAVARLQHPNIIQVFEIGTVEPQSGELHPGPFIALELVEGDSLACRAVTPQTPCFAAGVVEKLARAAHAAHRLGIIHRDLKPANVLLTKDDEPKIADFGLAKQIGADRDSSGRFVTQAGTVMGTPEYMAPEQAQGQPPTPAVDVYALGVILYELLTGRVPFHAATPVETMNQVVQTDPVSPRRLSPQVPRDLETICLKCLEKRADRRYASAEALADDLRRYLDGRTIQARPVAAPERLARWASRNPLPAALTAAVVLIGLIGLAGVLMKWREAELATAEARAHARAERWERYRADIIASAGALQIHNVGSARRTLDATPPEHRNWEWRHLHARLDLARTVLGPPDEATCFTTMSARGERVLIDGTSVRVWDTASGRLLLAVPPDGRPDHFHLSPDGKTLAYRRHGSEFVLYDLVAGRVSAVVRPLGRPADGVSFINNERLVTNDGKVDYRLWDVRRGTLVRDATPDTPAPLLIQPSPDGRQVALAGSGERIVRLVDIGTNQERLVLNLPPRKEAPGRGLSGLKAAFNPQGDRVLIVETYPGNAHHLWDARTGKLLSTRPGHLNSVVDAVFSPDGSRIATCGRDHTVRLWDGRTGNELAVLKGHRGTVDRVAFSPDGQRLVSASEDNTLRLWSPLSGEQLAVLHGHTRGVASVAYSADGRTIVSAALDGTVRLWDASAVENNGVLRGHSDFVYGVAFHPDGRRVASASWDGTARVWDVATGRQTNRMDHGVGAIVTSVAFHPGGKLLATRSRKAVRLWEVDTGRQAHCWDVPGDGWRDTRLTFSPDGTRLAAGCQDREVRVWDVPSKAEVSRLSGTKDQARDLAFSPDGGLLATAGEQDDRTVRLWDAARGEQLQVLEGHKGCVYAVAFNRAGTLLASGSLDGTVRLWDAKTWQEVAVLRVGIKVYGVAFTPDGTRLAGACADGSIRLWDVATRQEVAELRGHDKYVHQVAFSPDGTRLVSGSGDHGVRVWDTLSAQKRSEPVR